MKKTIAVITAFGLVLGLAGTGLASDWDKAGKALEATYGSVIVADKEEEIKGINLTSGALANDGVCGALDMLHLHQSKCEDRGIPETLWNKLSPAHLFHGMARTAHEVLASISGRRNVHHAMDHFSGDLWPSKP